MDLFARFGRDERGATAIEYGLIALLVSTMIIAGAKLTGCATNGLLLQASYCLSSAQSGGAAHNVVCN